MSTYHLCFRVKIREKCIPLTPVNPSVRGGINYTLFTTVKIDNFQMKNINFLISALKYEPRHEKTNVLVFDQVRHKPGCTVTEDS